METNQMPIPAEEVASQAVSQVSKMPTLVAIFGNGVAFLADHDKELQAISLTLTILWIIWQWGRSLLQDRRDRRISRAARKVEAWARGQGLQTDPSPLDDDPQEHHRGK